MYYIHLLFITDDLIKAKAKASVAEDTSDLASDHDGRRIRRKKKVLYSTNETQSAFSHSSCSSSDDEVAAPATFPVIHNYTSIYLLNLYFWKNKKKLFYFVMMKHCLIMVCQTVTGIIFILEKVNKACKTATEPSTSTDEPRMFNESMIIDVENMEPIKSKDIKNKLPSEGTIKPIHCNQRDIPSNCQRDNKGNLFLIINIE